MFLILNGTIMKKMEAKLLAVVLLLSVSVFSINASAEGDKFCEFYIKRPEDRIQLSAEMAGIVEARMTRSRTENPSLRETGASLRIRSAGTKQALQCMRGAVSNTHLTLPTKA